MAPKSKGSFDRRRLADFLNRWYESQMATALRKPRPPEETKKHGGTVFDIQPEMSSTKAVPVLLELTDILGFEPSKDVIKKGGYRTKDEFVNELCSRIEQSVADQVAAAAPVSQKNEKEEASKHAQL